MNYIDKPPIGKVNIVNYVKRLKFGTAGSQRHNYCIKIKLASANIIMPLSGILKQPERFKAISSEATDLLNASWEISSSVLSDILYQYEISRNLRCRHATTIPIGAASLSL